VATNIIIGVIVFTIIGLAAYSTYKSHKSGGCGGGCEGCGSSCGCSDAQKSE